MKKILICIQFLLLTTVAYATGQDSDVIYINGTRWALLDRPVCRDSLLYWSIEEDVFYLDSIRCEHYDINSRKITGERIPNDTLLRVFKNFVEGERIVASWLTDDIRVATGKRIYYQHMGFERNYEHEQIFTIREGKIIEKKDYHNYVVDGFAFDKVTRNTDIRKLFPLKTEKYPELANVKRIIFYIRQARVDMHGNLVECEVKVLKPGDNQQLAEEMTLPNYLLELNNS